MQVVIREHIWEMLRDHCLTVKILSRNCKFGAYRGNIEIPCIVKGNSLPFCHGDLSPSQYNFSLLHSPLHLMQCIYRDVLPLFKTGLNSVDFDAFQCFCCFLFYLFHTNKTLPFQDLFHQGKQKNVAWGETTRIGRVGHSGHEVFGQKLQNTQRCVGRCACKSPIVKWANVLKESLKKFTEVECSLSQQWQLVH